MRVWIGCCGVSRQVALEIRDEHGPGIARTETRQVTSQWNGKNNDLPWRPSSRCRTRGRSNSRQFGGSSKAWSCVLGHVLLTCPGGQTLNTCDNLLRCQRDEPPPLRSLNSVSSISKFRVRTHTLPTIFHGLTLPDWLS